MVWLRSDIMQKKVGMYCFCKQKRYLGIGKIFNVSRTGNIFVKFENHIEPFVDSNLEASYDITDLIKYMDLLEIEHPVKLYGIDKKVKLFNPVRCDGFAKFKDGTRCIILDLDYLTNVKDLKIKKILTREQFEEISYKVIDNEEN